MTLKRLMLIVVMTILVLFGIDQRPVSANTADSLVVHYYRYDEDYTDWSVWLWQDGIAGIEVQFSGTDSFGQTVSVDLPGNGFSLTQDVGILIAQIPEWIKDIEADRYIDISQPDTNGDVHVYLVQGEPYISYVESNQPGCDPDNKDPFLCAHELRSGLLDAFFNENLEIEFISTDSISASDITVYREGTIVSFTGFTSGSTGTLDLQEASTDVADVYTVQVDVNGTITELLVRVNAPYDSALFAQAYHYDGVLGVTYSNTETVFRVWAPLSSAVEVNLYSAGHTTATRADGADTPYEVHALDYIGTGVFEVTIPGDLNGVYYTFSITNSGTVSSDIPDPYGVTFGVNGLRSMVLDLDSTDPVGWELDAGIDGYANPNEAIIYELHVRDLTSQDAWGGPEEYQGTYMGFTIEDTSYTNSVSGVTVSTGLAHLIELGITHVHLLPTYDQDWNDERNFQFNWGYNPQHYNSPEGGYSTDPFDGAVRVNEFKQMIQALHSNGINVITDMVYNHTGPGAGWSFNRIVPGYFYRFNSDGSYSNGTGVGNETASERYMFRKYMVDSMVYWASEYNIDGFRYDLMAVHDYETMNAVSEAVEAIDPDIFVYGEPWGGGTIALPYDEQAGKQNLYRMPLVAAFNDEIRNAIKGSPDGSDKGYISNGYNIYTVMDGIAGRQLGTTSSQSVNYVSAHDNLTLYDKLKSVYNSTGYTEQIDYEARLANSIVMFSQGIPFLHAGVDFLRTKGGNHNSYDASDIVNQLSWVRKSMYVDSFEYYKGIIELRKEFDSFKMVDRTDIAENLNFLYPDGYGVIGYELTKNEEHLLVYHNSGLQHNFLTLPDGAWTLLADRDEAGLESLGTFSGTYPIFKAETLVFVPGNEADVEPSPTIPPEITNRLNVAYEGGDYTITSNTDIYAYNVDGGDYVTVDTPSTSVAIPGLTVGQHIIRIQDQFGTPSEPFTVTIFENTTVTCEDGYTLVDGECIEDIVTCEDGYSLVDGECVEDVVTCETGYSLVDGECVLDDVTCEDGYSLEDGECVLDDVTCEDGYSLIDGECILDDENVKFDNTGCFGSISFTNMAWMITLVGIGLSGIVLLRRKF